MKTSILKAENINPSVLGGGFKAATSRPPDGGANIANLKPRGLQPLSPDMSGNSKTGKGEHSSSGCNVNPVLEQSRNLSFSSPPTRVNVFFLQAYLQQILAYF